MNLSNEESIKPILDELRLRYRFEWWAEFSRGGIAFCYRENLKDEETMGRIHFPIRELELAYSNFEVIQIISRKMGRPVPELSYSAQIMQNILK